MQTFILKTDGGPHSPEDWAYVTASSLVDLFRVAPDSPNALTLERLKDRARVAIADAMTVHHGHCQTAEREALAGDPARINDALDAAAHVEIEEATTDALTALQPLLQAVSSIDLKPVDPARPLPDVTAMEFLEAAVRERVETDIRTIMGIERSWHADANPDCVHCQQFRAAQGE